MKNCYDLIASRSTEEIAWLAGLMEGEGCFMKGPPSCPHKPVIALSMTDIDVVERAAQLIGCSVVKLSTNYKSRKPHWKPAYAFRIRGTRAVNVMEAIKPYMGKRRTKKIEDAISCHENKLGKTTPQQREEIKSRFRNGENAKNLAKEFGITKWAVYAIHQERSSKRKPG